MPLMHRLACFRDDVVFLIFLYQVSQSSGVSVLKSRYSYIITFSAISIV